MPNLLVSVIVPTKNSEKFLEACLESIKNQTYKNIELIVVDNFSTDKTQEIAKKYTDNFFEQGPERNIQRNFGAGKSVGDFVMFVDSDMQLSATVVKECVEQIINFGAMGVIIPEESFGIGFWAQCKKLERSFYVGIDWMEAARFFKKEAFVTVGGYDENLISGEDWDLSQRIETLGKIGRIKSFIYHDEGRLALTTTLKKKYYYARQFNNYVAKKDRNLSKQTSILGRYFLFFSHPVRLFKNPFVGMGMLFMKTCEFGWGGIGILNNKIKFL